MPLLQFEEVQKRYGRKLILNIPEKRMGKGTHCLIGANGSGKTTLLKLLSGLVPFEGTITLNESIDLSKDRHEHRMKVNICEAEPLFPQFLTGQYLVQMYLKFKRGSPKKVNEIKSLLGIGDYLDQKIQTYSSGMKKKLALLLAFIGNPELILLDEPFNTLDPASQKALGNLISTTAQQDVSFIIASHQPFQLEAATQSSWWKIESQSLISFTPDPLASTEI